MRKTYLCGVMCLIALFTFFTTSCSKEETNNVGVGKYVDLGLSSGTLWRDKNEEGGLYTYDEAIEKFGDNIPTKQQLEELIEECQWTWKTNGYSVLGPSGESIFLPTGGIKINGYVQNEETGYYMSSTIWWSPTSMQYEGPWTLKFWSQNIFTQGIMREYGVSVRLVQNS